MAGDNKDILLRFLPQPTPCCSEWCSKLRHSCKEAKAALGWGGEARMAAVVAEEELEATAAAVVGFEETPHIFEQHTDSVVLKNRHTPSVAP